MISRPILLMLLALLLAACSAPPNPTSLPSATRIENAASPSPPSATPIPPTESPAVTPTATATATDTPQPSDTLTPTITPTYTRIRGVVNTHAQCRYGPGWAYLYRYGLLVGNKMEVNGRNELGTWIEVQAINADIYGGEPCWVRADLLDLDGDVMAAPVPEVKLPFSFRYQPPILRPAVRRGSEVVLFWDPVKIHPGNDSGQYPYLIEAWVCRDGQLVFDPVGTWELTYTLVDEPGCSEPSHGRIYSVEKHGYSAWREIPWP